MDCADVAAPWEPIGLSDVASLFQNLAVPWWVAGGWAIDLLVGHQTRSHADMDVLVLRRDQLEVKKHLSEWELYAADPPGSLKLWGDFEELSADVHDIWCRPSPLSPWALQLMLADSSDETWIYRRDPRIQLPLASIGRCSTSGLPYLAPEIQLLFKAKRPMRPQDEADSGHAYPLLDKHSKSWLREALTLTDSHHPWIMQL